MLNYDNPEVESQWFSEQHAEIAEYLKRERISHGSIGEEPAWHVAPYVSIWAVESLTKSGHVEIWVISGDLPTDYVTAQVAKNPREAMHAIASIWKEAAAYISRGEKHPAFIIGSGDNNEELAPMLASRAETLLEWVDDSECWAENEL